MTTFAKLKTSVDNWLARDDIAVSGSDFPEIMLIAESNMSRDLRLVVQEATVTLVFTGRSQDLPADFLEVRNPFIDDNIRKVEYQTPQALRESAIWTNGRVGAYYTLEGSPDAVAADDRVKVTIAGPASVASPLSFDVMYWRRFAKLVNDIDTNWLLVNHYDIPLYATLHAACVYTQEDGPAEKYHALYQAAIEAQVKAESRKRFGAMPKQAYASPRPVI